MTPNVLARGPIQWRSLSQPTDVEEFGDLKHTTSAATLPYWAYCKVRTVVTTYTSTLSVLYLLASRGHRSQAFDVVRYYSTNYCMY